MPSLARWLPAKAVKPSERVEVWLSVVVRDAFGEGDQQLGRCSYRGVGDLVGRSRPWRATLPVSWSQVLEIATHVVSDPLDVGDPFLRDLVHERPDVLRGGDRASVRRAGENPV